MKKTTSHELKLLVLMQSWRRWQQRPQNTKLIFNFHKNMFKYAQFVPNSNKLMTTFQFREFLFNKNVLSSYRPPAEKKKALVKERVGDATSPTPLQLNSQTAQVAILGAAAAYLVNKAWQRAAAISQILIICLIMDRGVSRPTYCSVVRRDREYFLESIRSYLTGWSSADAR